MPEERDPPETTCEAFAILMQTFMEEYNVPLLTMLGIMEMNAFLLKDAEVESWGVRKKTNIDPSGN